MKARKVISLLCLISAVGILGVIAYKDWPHVKGYIDSLRLYNRIQDEGAVPDRDGKDKPNRPFNPVREETEPEDVGDETEAETNLNAETEAETEAPLSEYEDYIEINWNKMRSINKDYIGWIYIPGTRISYPVVQSRDNADYLHRGFDGSYLFSGTIFMDCRNEDAGLSSKNAILYGHNMRIGTMFAGLKKYQEQKYYKKHNHFWFITEDKAYRYKIFACNLANPYDDNHFGVQYKSDKEFMTCMDEIVKKSLIKADVRPNARDHIMTLSTCTANQSVRNVVHGLLDGTVTLSPVSWSETETETETEAGTGN